MRLGIAETAFTSLFSDVEIAHSIGPSAEPTTSTTRARSVALLRTLRLAARMIVAALNRHAAGEAQVEHTQPDVQQQDDDRVHRGGAAVDCLDGSSAGFEAQ